MWARREETVNADVLHTCRSEGECVEIWRRCKRQLQKYNRRVMWRNSTHTHTNRKTHTEKHTLFTYIIDCPYRRCSNVHTHSCLSVTMLFIFKESVFEHSMDQTDQHTHTHTHTHTHADNLWRKHPLHSFTYFNNIVLYFNFMQCTNSIRGNTKNSNTFTLSLISSNYCSTDWFMWCNLGPFPLLITTAWSKLMKFCIMLALCLK